MVRASLASSDALESTRRIGRVFEELCAIVVGLGLAVAVEQTIDLDRSGLPIRIEHLAVFPAYLNFAFMLAHASVR